MDYTDLASLNATLAEAPIPEVPVITIPLTVLGFGGALLCLFALVDFKKHRKKFLPALGVSLLMLISGQLMFNNWDDEVDKLKETRSQVSTALEENIAKKYAVTEISGASLFGVAEQKPEPGKMAKGDISFMLESGGGLNNVVVEFAPSGEPFITVPGSVTEEEILRK